MPAFKGQLSATELASVITYTRNAFGNNTGTLVQPIQMQALIQGKSIEAALAIHPSALTPKFKREPAHPGSGSSIIPHANSINSAKKQ